MKDQKKSRLTLTEVTSQYSPEMDTDENKETAQVVNQDNPVTDAKLEGALGPLVQQIKLL